MTEKQRPAKSTIAEEHESEQDDAIIGVAFKWSLIVFVVLGLVGGALFYTFRPRPQPVEVEQSDLAEVQVREAPQVELPRIPFRDVTREAGVVFRHENGAYGSKLLPETMGGGAAFLDFDADGDQDILLVGGRRWPWDPRGQTPLPPSSLALYRNDGDGKFEDVTKAAGLAMSFYGMGVACGDYDNDGYVDVYFSAVGPNKLFHNEQNGTFREVVDSVVSGGAEDWGSSCGWLDYDRDGDLDLFVCNYVQWNRQYDESQGFQLTGGGRAYGRPQNFEGAFPALYRNDGEGRFVDVSSAAGLQIKNSATGVPMAKSLGVTFADFDNDQWPDIVVANDTVQNFLFHNRQDGTFEEIGAVAGVAFDMNGQARGAMGIDSAYFRDNDAVGIAIGNFSNEMTALYVSMGDAMQFMDEAISSGLGPNTRLELTFGLTYVDMDLDGRLDLLAANGHLEEDIHRVQPSQHYEQPPQLFWNCGSQFDTEFMPLGEAQCGNDFFRPIAGRGITCGDIDGDGDADVLIVGVGTTPRLLRNEQSLGHNWLRFSLRGVTDNRDAIGARVEVKVGDRTLRRQVAPTRSYLSQVELPVTIGIGDAQSVDSVEIVWPNGQRQGVEITELNTTYHITQQ